MVFLWFPHDLTSMAEANETQLVPPLEWLDSGDATQVALVLPGADGTWDVFNALKTIGKP